MSGDPNSEKRGEVWVWFILLGVISFAVIFGYDYFRYEINSVLISINKVFLYPFALFSGKAYGVYEKMNEVHPVSLKFSNIMAQYKFVGGYMRWPICALLLFLGLKAMRGLSVKEKFCNRYNIQKLLEHNINAFPAIAPIVYRDVLSEPLDEGPWRTARQPIQFAVEHDLLYYKDSGKTVERSALLNDAGLANINSDILKKDNNTKIALRTEKLRDIFIEQLGMSCPLLQEMEDYQRGVAAVFLAFGHGERERAQKLLDQMNLSFEEEQIQKIVKFKKLPPFFSNQEVHFDYKLDIPDADKIIAEYKNSEKVLKVFSEHGAYLTTFLHGLKVFADKKGVLPPAQFLWLKTVDRTLWYTLHQIGGRTSWAEASGPWNHYMAEDVIGQAINEPEIDNAVKAFKSILRNQGWLSESIS